MRRLPTVDGAPIAPDEANDEIAVVRHQRYGSVHDLTFVKDARARNAIVVRVGDAAYVIIEGHTFKCSFGAASTAHASTQAVSNVIRSPMACRLIAIYKQNGERVAAGEPMVRLESMKLESIINAPHAGIVTSLAASVGDSLPEGTSIATIEPPSTDEEAQPPT
jgi:biotin carboxyl carrier protein